ncbi:hypothetical protein [Nocardia sp. NPDC048505]|uniref:hypothetical protein n=1 Tax=unclassified Nocardia TaxID=2637762 RepID=UPI0033CCFD1D
MSHVLPTVVSVVSITIALTALLASAVVDARAGRATRAAESCFINGDLPTDDYFVNSSRSARYEKLALRLLACGVVLLPVGIALSGWATWLYTRGAH